ncbi:hypothetical protein LT337_32035 (plasmid) [Mycolicibacterium fortuitum]|nr:hypothetical protein LT337_32035 [Mycolicibacterium fortuitum]
MSHNTVGKVSELAQAAFAWSDLSRPVYTFALVLREADLMPDREDEYWEEPEKWDREHCLWVELGEPRPPGRGEPTSLAWEKFVRDAIPEQWP